jgi:hypothetical protein
MSADGTKRTSRRLVTDNLKPVQKKKGRNVRPSIQSQTLGFSGHLGEAGQGIVRAVVEATNSATVVSLFVDFQVRSQK